MYRYLTVPLLTVQVAPSLHSSRSHKSLLPTMALLFRPPLPPASTSSRPCPLPTTASRRPAMVLPHNQHRRYHIDWRAAPPWSRPATNSVGITEIDVVAGIHPRRRRPGMAPGQGGCQGEESLPGHLEGRAAGGQVAIQAHSTCGLPAGRIVAEDTKDTSFWFRRS